MEKKVSLQEDGFQVVDFDLPVLRPGTYEVVFSAVSGEEKSLLKLRIPVMGEKARLIYTGLSGFPLKKNESTVLFACFSQSADYNTGFNGTLTVEVFDREGRKVFSETSAPTWIHPTPPQALMTLFTPTEDMNYLVVKASISDERGNLHDQVSLVYDYSKFVKLRTDLNLSLAVDEVYSGGLLEYTITLLDELGNPVMGEVYVYVKDSNNKLVGSMDRRKVDGRLLDKKMVSGRDGIYKLVVSEVWKDNSIEASFNLYTRTVTTTTYKPATTVPSTEAEKTTTPSRINPADIYPYAVVGLAIILVVYFLWDRRKKK